ncbi:RHE_PE00001 family protein [Mesorhizobium sp. WSM2239]|uniref:RHE_PE00001 family protein n=2 Tax=unclassified Mesorhizobium TaxID=325217 RepID=A0AAU8DGP9_9HYPH
MTYDIGKLPLETLIGRVVRATEVLSRLDERLARSPVRDGFVERQHFADAAAALWIEGELVHVEDLVLHDAHMDIRTPTHELTRAHAVLRARRQIFTRAPDWALSGEGLRRLTGRGPPVEEVRGVREGALAANVEAGETSEQEDDLLAEELAAIDAVLERSTKVLDGAERAHVRKMGPAERPSLIYDLDWDEDARLAEWQAMATQTRELPTVLRAALLLESWAQIEVLQHAGWLGPLLVAALLRREGVTTNYLTCLHLGAQKVPRDRRCARIRTDRLLALLDVMCEAALAGLKEHDRLMLAHAQMERRLRNRRASSRLPGLVELVLSRPFVSTAMIQETLKVSKQGALNLVGDLRLREMTGRGRFRAWGIV